MLTLCTILHKSGEEKTTINNWETLSLKELEHGYVKPSVRCRNYNVHIENDLSKFSASNLIHAHGDFPTVNNNMHSYFNPRQSTLPSFCPSRPVQILDTSRQRSFILRRNSLYSRYQLACSYQILLQPYL